MPATTGAAPPRAFAMRAARATLGGSAAVLALAAALAGGTAHASGFALREQSSTAQGAAFAGAAAGGSDISYLFFNPAAIGLHPGANAQASFSYVIPESRVKNAEASTIAGQPIDGSTDNLADVANGALLPALYGSVQATDDLFFGVGVNAPFGLVTQYPEQWVGRYHAVDSELDTVNINPAVAWRAREWLTFGAGLQVQRAAARLTNAVDTSTIAQQPNTRANDTRSELEGDDWSLGYTLGAIVEPIDGTRLGLSYRSRVEHRLEGEADFFRSALGDGVNAQTTTPGGAGLLGDSDINADLTTPELISFGVTQDVGERWTLLGGVEWTGWSSFDELEIDFDNPDQPNSFTNEDWDDSWYVALGAAYRPSDAWTLSAGVAYDQSPVPDDYRTPRVPDSDRYWLSLGAEWRPADWFGFNVAATQIYVEDTEVEISALEEGEQARGNFSADYDSRISILTIGGSLFF